MSLRTGAGSLIGTLRRLITGADVIVRCAQGRPRRCGVGIEFIFGNDSDAAILTHSQQIEALRTLRIHPVLALKLCNHPLDRAFYAEGFAATRAVKWLFFFEHPRHRGRGAEIELRLELDHFLGTRRLA